MDAEDVARDLTGALTYRDDLAAKFTATLEGSGPVDAVSWWGGPLLRAAAEASLAEGVLQARDNLMAEDPDLPDDDATQQALDLVRGRAERAIRDYARGGQWSDPIRQEQAHADFVAGVQFIERWWPPGS
jgi:hypothetical protein